MSWGWRKLLQIREIMRPYVWVQLGNGRNTSFWFDNWCLMSPLKRFLTVWEITQEGFSIYTSVADMESNGAWMWPNAWLQKAPALGNIPTPILDNTRADVAQWLDINGDLKEFSVKNVWEAIRPRVFTQGFNIVALELSKGANYLQAEGLDIFSKTIQQVVSELVLKL
ncbi:hypothetical protein Tco_0931290 [Tanacetum coccineum]